MRVSLTARSQTLLGWSIRFEGMCGLVGMGIDAEGIAGLMKLIRNLRFLGEGTEGLTSFLFQDSLKIVLHF